jgi:hypothetical protein
MENGHTEFRVSELLVGFFFLTLPVDALCIVIDLTGVGLAVAPFLQGFALFCVRWWFKMKGDPNALQLNVKQVVRYLSNVLPLVPTVTIVFLIDAYVHNHPEKFKTLQTVSALGKADISLAKLKDIKEAKGTVAAAREVYKQYRTVRAAAQEDGAGSRPRSDIKKVEYKQAA